MSGLNWKLSHKDTAARALVVHQVTKATLGIEQTGSHLPDPVLLGTFELSCKKPVPDGQSDTVAPWSLAWHVPKELGFLGTATLEADKDLKIESFTRNKSDAHCVRSLGGPDHEKHSPGAARVRGGYLFAKASVEDSELRVNGRAHPDQLLLAVHLSFDKGRTKYLVPFLYGKDPREEWIYEKHTFKLSFALKVGDRTWRAEGPELTSPAHEFLSSATATNLKHDLSGEYGNLALRPPLVPLHPRDFSDCLKPGKALVDAFRTHVIAAAQFINGQISEGKTFDVAPLEIASTMLTEGGVEVLRDALHHYRKPDKVTFAGFGNLGIDSYANRWDGDEGNLRAYTKDILEPFLTDPKKRNLETVGDEQNRNNTTFKTLNLEQAVYAVAGLYAFFKERFADALADEGVMGPWATTAKRLPPHVQHFWSSFYFNTSSGMDRGTPKLRERSVELHDLPWEQEDEFETFKLDGKYNATWRTATFRLLQILSPLDAPAEAAEPAKPAGP